MTKKINYVQIIFPFIASYFIIFSFEPFSWLYSIKILELTKIHGARNVFDNQEKYGITPGAIALFSFWPSVAVLAGIVFAFIISILISKIKKWSILNSFIVLTLIYLLYRFDLLGWDYIRSYLSVGRFTNDYQSKFIINGSILLIIALIIFFSKWTNRIIQNQYQKIN
ncbi:hypothetical protein [Flavobacterium pectinovorum]|uniref:Uncharacterized protein n=1 Tax=Flavobacterium pectinovorum TaxID=29533 RepID=A0A502EZT2_9FLAO|nr:hypothetical protein [Flavobacterium pectinovorum]TPG41691.1 hypothetical protein EAH81_09430 [Flavobacterium pectinovorum]